MKRSLLFVLMLLVSGVLFGAQPYTPERQKEKEEIIRRFVERSRINLGGTFRSYALPRQLFMRSLEQRDELVLVGDSRVVAGDHFLGGWARNLKAGTRAVANFGVAGATVDEWASRVPLQIIISRNPRIIVIAAGGNDKGDGSADEAFLGRLQAMIFALRDFTDAKIYIHGILPIIHHGNASNDDIRKTNALMKILCAVNDVPFIDLFDRFIVPGKQTWGSFSYRDVANFSYLLMDEIPLDRWERNGSRPVHFNEEGYRLWFKLLTEYFTAERAREPAVQ